MIDLRQMNHGLKIDKIKLKFTQCVEKIQIVWYRFHSKYVLENYWQLTQNFVSFGCNRWQVESNGCFW